MAQSTTILQRGQAMVETLIAASLVLVPLFLAIPVLAKYLDIRSHLVQAARYTAWERTVWFGGASAKTMGFTFFGRTVGNVWDANEKTDGAIGAEIGARILSNTGASDNFKSTDQTNGSFVGGQKPLWQDRRGQALLDYGDISQPTITNGPSPGLITTILGPIANVAALLSSFTVDTNAQYTSKVSLGIQQFGNNIGSGTNDLGGCPGCPVDFLATGVTTAFSESSVLVANGWSANGPGSLIDNGTHPKAITVYNQIRGLTPTSLLNPPPGTFRDVLSVVQTLLSVFFPELSTLELGKIEVDKVPPDRLQ